MTTVPKSIFSQAWDAGKGLFKRIFKSSSGEEKFDIPPTEDMMKRCLAFYLEPSKSTLLSNGEFPGNFSISEFGKQVKDILEQHTTPVVQHYNTPYPVPVEGIKLVSDHQFCMHAHTQLLVASQYFESCPGSLVYYVNNHKSYYYLCIGI